MKLVVSLVFAVTVCLVQSDQIDYATKPNIDVICGSPELSQYSRIGNKYYVIGESSLTWLESIHLCRRIGGDLAQIDSSDEMNAISSYLQSRGTDRKLSFWISGFRKQQFLSLSTGFPLLYFSWAPGKPDVLNEECIYLNLVDGAYRMHSAYCSQRRRYICQKQNSTHCQVRESVTRNS